MYFALSKMQTRKTKLCGSVDSQIQWLYFCVSAGGMALEVLLVRLMKNMPLNDKIGMFSMGAMLWECGGRQGPLQPLALWQRNLGGLSSVASLVGHRFQQLWPKALKQLIYDCVIFESGNRLLLSSPTTMQCNFCKRNWAGSNTGSMGDMGSGL
ncbi:unnamed protein product [Ostreobium quekettii]|uniref:Uncharacterized protein n=1 Tax=Ostreobium quekettii TaxID=121088 RepID=A0A8S1IU12_9CHLO|nr:unnamed protein product [Ostreobium quekettii]CAD7698500.1 unnamed protein product [Ostreobium quekettii]|eukprot:evm.model.scf_434.2 EVM.evm.TU.scf_434.2   scf_434:35963-36424(+)